MAIVYDRAINENHEELKLVAEHRTTLLARVSHDLRYHQHLPGIDPN